MRFEADEAAFACHREQIVEHLQSLKVSRLAVFSRRQDSQDTLEDLDHGAKRIRDQESSKCSSSDDDQFGRLQ